MGIDRIGKGSAPPPEALTPKDAATRGKSAAPFEIKRDSAVPTPAMTHTTEIQPSDALDGVRSGRLDVKGYVDAKVHEATAHLSHLSPTQLSTVQSIVRQQLLSDPHLAELVEHATGSAVPKDEE